MTTTSESTKWIRLKQWMSGETRRDDGLVGPREEPTEEPGLLPRHAVKAAAALAVLLLLGSRPAHGQLGFDLAAILAALQQMQSLMQQYIAAPLKLINQSQQSIANYEKQIMYPVQKIQQAQSSVSQLEGQSRQVTGLFHLNFSSATLPPSQSLESLLLSRNPNNIPGIGNQFQNVYGAVMPVNAASPEVRNMTDSTDAQAQDAMKRAVAIDALADAELAQADKMGQQIALAAPGSAPILEAEADAWVVRANAYTQTALAELMRTRGIDIANQSKAIKLGSSDNTATGGIISTSLSH